MVELEFSDVDAARAHMAGVAPLDQWAVSRVYLADLAQRIERNFAANPGHDPLVIVKASIIENDTAWEVRLAADMEQIRDEKGGGQCR